MSGGRERLPGRRENRTRRLAWSDGSGAGFDFDITVGFYPAARDCSMSVDGAAADGLGAAGEVFIAGAKAGSMLLGTLEDACVLVSRLLQMGVTLDELHAGLGRGSPVGAVVLAAIKIARDPDGLAPPAMEPAP